MKKMWEKIFDYAERHPILTAPLMFHICVVFFVCTVFSIAIGKPIVDVELRDA